MIIFFLKWHVSDNQLQFSQQKDGILFFGALTATNGGRTVNYQLLGQLNAKANEVISLTLGNLTKGDQYHARFALSTTSFKKFSLTSLPLRSRSPLPRNALRRFAPSEHILIYQLYSPSSTTFFTCFLSLSFVRFLSLFIPLLYLLIRFIRPFFTPSLLFVLLPLPLLNK